MAASSSSSQHRSRFGDTTLTKVFVGGLAWETPTDELRHYFEQFGEILEAVVITDKNTGRSKGYGFVTFKDPDSARRAVEDPNPVIDGRQANCNIASMGRPRPTPAPPRGRNQMEGLHQGPPRATGPPQYSRVREQMPSPAVFYNPQIGFMTYPAEYSYQQGFYNPQVTPQYYHQMYGPTSPSTLGSPYYYTNMGYMPNPRAGFLSPQQGPRHLYIQYPAAQMERPFTPSLPDNFQLQPPPNARPPTNTMDSQASQPSSAAGDT